MLEAAVRLEVKGVSKRFGGVAALSNVDLVVRAGEVHAICGENGAGKSTLMKVLSGAITDYEGTVLLNGRAVAFTGPRDAEEAGVSIIYQELNLAPDLSAAANIFLGREITRLGVFLNDRKMESEAKEYFDRLGATFSPHAKIRDLRIGDQQLVEIAKALSLDADIVIMDEPTSALAEGEVARLFGVIESLKEHGVTVLYITHKMDEVFRLADRITVMRDGRRVATVDRASTTASEIIQSMVGREIAALAVEESSRSGREVLAVDGLSLANPRRVGRWLLQDIHLRVHSGEVVGIAGLMGAGRTELLESLFGAAPAKPTGTIRLHGRPVRIDQPRTAVSLGIAMVTEDRKQLGLFDQMTVSDNITICHLEDVTRAGFLSARREQDVVRESVNRLSIRTAGGHSPIVSLSGGNQQKCILARWLLTQPMVLLLDEPTRGIDVGAKAEIYALLRRLAGEGLAILMTSSELPELLTVCDRILVLCEGRLTAEFTRADATEEKIMHAATSRGQGSAVRDLSKNGGEVSG